MHDAERLFNDHAAALFRYLVRFTGDADLASDCVQETFVRVLDRSSASEIQRAWLFTVATNLALEFRRTSSRRARLLDASSDRIPLADASPTPLEHVEARERHERAVRALATLSEKERSAVLMREEGFSHREIAEAVGTTTGSVGTLVARALLKFADAIGGDE
jgi:RNA polymerase sigma-70 factor (ECF subfamily)